MGEVNKLLIDIQGEPLIRRTAKSLLAYGMEELVVVVGHEADKVIAVIDDLNLNIVTNQDYEKGQMTSVHCGLKALTCATDGIMICLSDLVLLTTQDLADIHSAYVNQKAEILVPTYEGERGNPIIFSPSQRQAIVAGERNLGCRKLINKNPDLVTVYEAENDHVTFDLDTPAAIAKLAGRIPYFAFDMESFDMESDLERTA
jgi:molybdenum cofactor cytidylyltransferase